MNQPPMFEALIIPENTPAPLAAELRRIDGVLIKRGRKYMADNPLGVVKADVAAWPKNSLLQEKLEAITTDPRPMLARKWGAVTLGAHHTRCHHYARLLQEQMAARQTEQEAA